MKRSRRSMYYRIGVIVVLVLVIVIVFKYASTRKETAEDLAEIPGYAEESLAWHSLPKEKIDAESLSTEPELVNKQSGTVESKPPLNKGALVVVDQEALATDNPLSKALKLGQPVVADFGKGTCIPCKMMEPILKKLEEEYAGRASILILDVDEYRSLSRKYRVMMIPTQIFFDSDGKEVYRHQGFMSETAIIVKLKDLGVE